MRARIGIEGTQHVLNTFIYFQSLSQKVHCYFTRGKSSLHSRHKPLASLAKDIFIHCASIYSASQCWMCDGMLRSRAFNDFITKRARELTQLKTSHT